MAKANITNVVIRLRLLTPPSVTQEEIDQHVAELAAHLRVLEVLDRHGSELDRNSVTATIDTL
jgi:hypothetical protein